MSLSAADKQKYLQEYTIPNFKPLIDQDIFSAIFDTDHKIVICTNATARSIGCNEWQHAVGLSFRDYDNVELAKKIFGIQYNDKSQLHIHQYAKKIYEVQKRVFEDKMVISFLDLLPYDGHVRSYIVMYTPIFHHSGEIVGIQSFASYSRFFSHKEYFNHITQAQDSESLIVDYKLTEREHEIMFLLASGSTQDQISQILQVSRSTVANIISNQLSVKFGLFGANTKLLAQKALQHNFHQTVPKSLYRPYIVVLDENE